jgi:hypothetical protein
MTCDQVVTKLVSREVKPGRLADSRNLTRRMVTPRYEAAADRGRIRQHPTPRAVAHEQLKPRVLEEPVAERFSFASLRGLLPSRSPPGV